jgi:hypothetical protein
MRSFVLAVLAACSAPKSPAPTTVSTPPPAPDAAPDAFVDTELAAAPPSRFRYNADPRNETWTLRHASGRAELVVEAKTTTVFTGTAVEANGTLAIEVATANAKQSLACKPDKLAVVPATAVVKKCVFDPARTTQVDVLSCKVPGFDVPMPFGAPGVEYVQAAGCANGAGYRALP